MHTTPGLSLLCVAALASSSLAQQILVPAQQSLGSSSTSTSVFRTTAGRFQVAYDSTLFTNVGVTGPITVTRLRFRRIDGRRNPGGNTYADVSVEVGNSALDYASLSTTFATNRGTMGAPHVSSLVVGPAEGTYPNDYIIDVPLPPASQFVYDPTTGTDLLIDVTMPTAPTTPPAIEGVACSNASAQGGRIVSASTATAATGTASFITPVCLIDFVGPGGYASPIPARVQSYGAGCGAEAASFYQAFPLGEDFDLRGNPARSLLLTPDNAAAPNFYVVTSGTTAPDTSATALGVAPPNTGDDSVVAHTPGFTFNFPGGSTTTFGACCNGYVWLGSNTTGDFSPTLAEFLGTPSTNIARLAPVWHDWHGGRNLTSHPGSGMYVNTDLSGGPGNGVTYVTWKEMADFAVSATTQGISVNTFQCVIFENGNVEFRYGAMNGDRFGDGITGFSRGNVGGVAAVDPGSRDLSVETPFQTRAEGTRAHLGHGVSARAILGSSITFTGLNNTGTALVSGIVLGVNGNQPGVPVPGFPDCLISVNLATAVTYELFFSPPAGTVTSAPLNIPPLSSGLLGVRFRTQYATVEPTGRIETSNALLHQIGLQ